MGDGPGHFAISGCSTKDSQTSLWRSQVVTVRRTWCDKQRREASSCTRLVRPLARWQCGHAERTNDEQRYPAMRDVRGQRLHIPKVRLSRGVVSTRAALRVG